jgi:hypothetical protein
MLCCPGKQGEHAEMDTMYIIKSGDMRWTKGGGSDGGRAGFSARISLKTAHKMGRRETAEKHIKEMQERAKGWVEHCENIKPSSGGWYTPERIDQELASYREELALWQAARIVEVRLTEA